MPSRQKRIYVIDSGPYQDLIGEFLASASIDPSYAVAVSRTAQTLRNKRRKFSDKKDSE